MTHHAKYLKEIAKTLSPVTVTHYTGRLNKFHAWQKMNKRYELDRSAFRDFLVYLQDIGTGPASICYYKSTLKCFCTWLVENEIIQTNPVRDIQFGHYKSPPTDKDHIFTEKEYLALKAKAAAFKPEWWLGAIIVAWNTGLRLGDVANLSCKQIDLPNKRIALMPNKTKRIRKVVEIPILPELFDYLSRAKFEGDFILPEMQARYARSGTAGLTPQFAKLCHEAGIKGKTFHFFRHGFTSRLLNKGIPSSVVGSITGHTLKVLQSYSHVSFSESQQLMERAFA